MRPGIKKANLAPLLAICLGVALVLSACSGSSLRGTSSGWSPVAAVALPLDSGSRINEGRNLDPLDITFTVSSVTAFAVGQVLQIDDERLIITAIREQDLTVSRGVDNTRPQSHADQSSIFTIGSQFALFVSTRQGQIKALLDDGLGAPTVQWSVSQKRDQR